MATPTQAQIMTALHAQETNLCAWAKAHQYKYTTVFNTVGRWAGRDDRTPHGGIARLIMSDLTAFVEDTKVRNSGHQVANQSSELGSSVRNS